MSENIVKKIGISLFFTVVLVLIIVVVIVISKELERLDEKKLLPTSKSDRCEEDFLEQYEKAIQNKDSSVCQEFRKRGYDTFKIQHTCIIPNGTIVELPTYHGNALTEEDCYHFFADLTQDITICKEYCSGTCLDNIRGLRFNSTKCEILVRENETYCHDFCLHSLAFDTVKPELCEKIINPEIKGNCSKGYSSRVTYDYDKIVIE